ncbi:MULTISPECIES: CDP-diacylglycerol--serine O-phosphatidyltransferase [Sediminimonas]|uniref:CDP-diacylglycerol--serine O-phosphatidyltransferase n=1 Tax=Sediminimonas TaxID=659427 RepID=UPI000416A2DD|nr:MULTISPECIES: CDP-diacylglycerol--serine O-phosphatidyltransferase [Sediminimonas]MDR9485298.1 CDP-diacylglycerol--serine O-phosphatidyltransferase [Sediminimonas sp.]
MTTARPKRELRIVQLLPNMMTVAAICAGLTAIRFASQGNFKLAVQLILLAAILDGLDGRLARLLKSESPMGAELDSLADFQNFGIATGLLIYFWAFQDMHNLGWIAVVVYALCCVLRLARFNVSNKSDEPAPAHFIGVPAPAGAFLALLPVFASLAMANDALFPAPVVGAWIIAIGFLMISRVPTLSLKALMIRRGQVRYAYVAFICFLGALIGFPWLTLTGLGFAYMISVAWTWRRHSPTAEDEQDI